MPTDEQLREQFGRWVGEHIKQWEAPGTTPAEHQENVKHWLAMSDGEHFDHHATQGWWTGFRARDAEVQALRLALSDILRRATLPVLPDLSAHGSVLADVAREARAALAGEEATDE